MAGQSSFSPNAGSFPEILVQVLLNPRWQRRLEAQIPQGGQKTQILYIWPWSAVCRHDDRYILGDNHQLFNWRRLGKDPLLHELKQWWQQPAQKVVRSPRPAGASGRDSHWTRGREGRVCPTRWARERIPVAFQSLFLTLKSECSLMTVLAF